MSLPFLRKKQVAGIIMAKRQPDGSKMETHESDEKDYDSNDLKACAQDLLSAIEAKDVDKIAAVLKSAHEICDMEPHEEGEHTNEEQEE